MSGTIALSKLSKLQRHNVGDTKDIISELPEGVLLYILSFLPTKDAHGSREKHKSENCLIEVEKLLQRSNCVERLCIKVRGTIDAQKATSLLSSTFLHKVLDLKLSIEDINAMFVLPNSFSASQSLNNLYLQNLCLTYAKDTLHLLPSFDNLMHLDVFLGYLRPTTEAFLNWKFFIFIRDLTYSLMKYGHQIHCLAVSNRLSNYVLFQIFVDMKMKFDQLSFC
ncbi:F-box/LRR-repeat protein [Trifolium repens]|nr:F-box/LRR-repeat protein [Trifolium repens]